jgi:hypothetical protein
MNREREKDLNHKSPLICSRAFPLLFLDYDFLFHQFLDLVFLKIRKKSREIENRELMEVTLEQDPLETYRTNEQKNSGKR